MIFSSHKKTLKDESLKFFITITLPPPQTTIQTLESCTRGIIGFLRWWSKDGDTSGTPSSSPSTSSPQSSITHGLTGLLPGKPIKNTALHEVTKRRLLSNYLSKWCLRNFGTGIGFTGLLPSQWNPDSQPWHTFTQTRYQTMGDLPVALKMRNEALYTIDYSNSRISPPLAELRWPHFIHIVLFKFEYLLRLQRWSINKLKAFINPL